MMSSPTGRLSRAYDPNSGTRDVRPSSVSRLVIPEHAIGAGGTPATRPGLHLHSVRDDFRVGWRTATASASPKFVRHLGAWDHARSANGESFGLHVHVSQPSPDDASR